MLRSKAIIGLIASGLLGATASAQPDAVVDWNAITLDAVTIGRPGPIGMVDVALVQVAVHDAVQAIDRRFEPYLVEIPGARGRRSAAVAAAAHDVLVGMYPTQAASTRRHVFHLPGGQRSQRRPGDPGRTAGRCPHASAAAREPGPVAAAVRGWHQPRRLAADQLIPGKSACASSILTDGRAVDGRV